MEKIFENNKKWVERKLIEDKDYFSKLAMGQKPRYLYIGCSDSRIPINEVTGTGPGEIFVHRNIANMVVHTDMNLLSVLQYAVEVLKVKDIIVCGHYGCGGVAAAASNKQFGLLDNWLRNIKDVIRLHEQELMSIEDEDQRHRRLVELNITEQVLNLSKTSIIQNAMQTEDPPKLYGLVYDLKEGLLRDLNVMEQQNSMKRYEHIYGLL
ncbi:carbonic anhydrase [Pontibacter virosus]|uniref:Carbonic anhydrase n=1 Tax=Pontibacter virosus TaxID=1765052 RepID=A0A2U1AY31_9BACT|nr:carbonic anhydrase [Pontibacter virosus]PVY41251.1 carbonic anhydrase [Pontibacter virosus]